MKHSLDSLRKKASKAYYSGDPIMTNEEYDALFGETGGVGSGEAGEVPHLRPMWSLQKYYVGEGNPPLTGDLVKTPKLDGAAVSILYKNGYLVRALTRGDGEKGRVITDKLMRIAPPGINMDSTIQVVGEVVAKLGTENARNFANGALNLKNIDEFEARVKQGELIFVAYGMEFDDERKNFSTYVEELQCLDLFGFHTVDTVDYGVYPTDGFVYRLNSNEHFRSLGYTSKHPRGSYAEKTRDTPVETKLLDVVWQTGKSGKVTPVAILEPIVIDDAVISRATLNNMAYIDALGLEIGCKVKVIRAGKIIPCVVARA